MTLKGSVLGLRMVPKGATLAVNEHSSWRDRSANPTGCT